jgi:hypothetical protein
VYTAASSDALVIVGFQKAASAKKWESYAHQGAMERRKIYYVNYAQYKINVLMAMIL